MGSCYFGYTVTLSLQVTLMENMENLTCSKYNVIILYQLISLKQGIEVTGFFCLILKMV